MCPISELTDMYRTFYPIMTKYTYFSSIYGMSSIIDYMLCYKINFSKFNQIKIILSILSEHNSMKPEYKNKIHKHMEIKHQCPELPMDKRRNWREIKNS